MTDPRPPASDPPPRSIESVFADFLDEHEEGGMDIERLCAENPGRDAELRELYEQWRLLAPLRRLVSAADTVRHPGHGTGQQIGDYRLVRLLGRGGMGEVWEAVQVTLHRRVALKLLRPGVTVSEREVARFLREAEAGGRLSHPAIVAVHDRGEEGGQHYIVQELVEGGHNLWAVLDERRRRDELPDDHSRWVATFFRQVAEALQVAHEAGVIHRDVKPANILVTPHGLPKITDFGIAALSSADPISVTGELSGTYCYMSPEQASGRRMKVDARTDVFSLCATMYEALTLRRPYDGDTPHQVLEQVLLTDPPAPSSLRSRVPEDLSTICMTGLEKRCERRYPSMAALADDLRRHLANEPIRARPPSVLRRGQKWIQRHRALSLGMGLGFLALLGMSALYWQARVARRDADEVSQYLLRLSDQQTLLELQRRQSELWPAHPERERDLNEWLRAAEELIAGLPAHESFLVRLEDPRSAASLSLTPAEREWWRNALTELVGGVHELQEPETGVLASVRQRLQDARTLAQRSVEAAPEAWEEAVFEISESHLYGGLPLAPCLGLVPLGPDPGSGLWEFWHVSSGARPGRDEDGRVVVTGDSGLVLVLLPGGSFTMGAQAEDVAQPRYDAAAYAHEAPVHEVTLSPFFVSKYEVTQEQWTGVLGFNPTEQGIGPDQPVSSASWHECDEFVRRMGLELPTEAQWEYACRAGTETPWWTGAGESSLQGADNLADRRFLNAGYDVQFAEDWLDDGHAYPAPVGCYRANPFGLHDMHGNVSEWCREPQCQYTSPPRPGDGLREGRPERPRRMLRGGSWFGVASHARSSYRYFQNEDHRFISLGLRPVMALPDRGR